MGEYIKEDKRNEHVEEITRGEHVEEDKRVQFMEEDEGVKKVVHKLVMLYKIVSEYFVSDSHILTF